MRRQALTKILGTAVLLLGGCVVAESYPADGPPAPQSEVVLVAPGPGFVWIGGEWAWHDRWVWVGGHWAHGPHPQAVWVPSTWTKTGNVFKKTPGHWK
jgi:hypothetical protein